MAFLYDTCTVSEFVQAMPNAKVIAYLSSLPNHQTYISAVSIGEILFGIELLPPSAKRRRLEEWYAHELLPAYTGRILPNDLAVMQCWGPLMASLQRRGFQMGIKDSLIAACALQADLTVITRNDSDFAHCGVRIVNPWKL
jgi:toxin FitB